MMTDQKEIFRRFSFYDRFDNRFVIVHIDDECNWVKRKAFPKPLKVLHFSPL